MRSDSGLQELTRTLYKYEKYEHTHLSHSQTHRDDELTRIHCDEKGRVSDRTRRAQCAMSVKFSFL